MLSLQHRELLTKSEVFEKQRAMTVEESEDHTRQEYNRVSHVGVLSRFACEWQCRILLKSQADRVLANDRTFRTRGATAPCARSA
jgi:hypothetical protein